MTYLLSGFFVLTVGALALAVRFFVQREREWRGREEEWRKRERQLLNEIGRANGVAPLRVEQERVVKIPDPEVSPLLNDIDSAMYEDDLLEDLEHFHNLGRGMSPAEARHRYPTQWAEVKMNYDAARTPLRVQ